MKIALVRPPALPAYHDVDIKEDPMLTALLGYLLAVGIPQTNIQVFDFQLDKTIDYSNLLHTQFNHYVIAARDVGESYRYALRTSRLLARDTQAKIWLYGQIAPLKHETDLPDQIHTVIQSEQAIAKAMGLSEQGPHFNRDLCYQSYYDYIQLADWQQSRKKGVLETSRGCPYRCRFCFITAGQNYEKQWQLRPNATIIADLHHYLERGITDFVFLDSEFLGANKRHHALRRELLLQIIQELPPITYMILCRADTLKAFNEFDLLKQSGLKKVLVGVESLYQPDLDALQKDSKVEIMMESILRLIEHEVECCLTYLTFHRNTTLQGLKTNIENIRLLYKHPKARYLGMPNFSFNLEVIRDQEQAESLALYELSENTYLPQLVESRGQPNKRIVCFPTCLEPLIEILRMLQYEWVVKKCELIRIKPLANAQDREKIQKWFNQLGIFCLDVMSQFIERFELQCLNFSTLAQEKERLVSIFTEFYTLLPSGHQELATFSHLQNCHYNQKSHMEDHGWDSVLPPLEKTNPQFIVDT